MKQRFSMFVAMCAIAAAPVLAQTGQAGQSQSAGPGKGKTGAAKSADAQSGKAASPDLAFAKEAAMGGMAEVELGNLAKEKAASSDVKAFGDRMVTDHSKGNDELKQWAQQKNITLPATLDAKHKATRDRLAKMSGEAFDRAYMADMVMDHQHDVAAFKRESTTGKDADLKAWAGKTLPTLQEHLTLAKTTATKVGANGKAKAKTGEPKK